MHLLSDTDERRAVVQWRRDQLARAGFTLPRAATLARDARYDLHEGGCEVASYGPRTTSGEPVFAPDPDDPSEDGGWVLNICHDWDADESTVRILDAGTMQEAARVHLPRRVPFGFHGSFIPAG